MNWEQYENTLNAYLADWFNQISAIQKKVYSDEEVLFELNKNTLDAFSAMVDVYSSGLNFEQWTENEKVRQRQKSLQGKIGDLHEIMILALNDNIKKREPEVIEGYDRPLRIYDLYDDTSDNKWIAEVKNKHNTTKGDDRKASFDKLSKGLELVGEEYTAYYVTILRKSHHRVNELFTPSDNMNANNKQNEKIVHIDGESFYAKLTDDENALSNAFDILNLLLREKFEAEGSEDILQQLKRFSFFNVVVNINTANEAGLSYLPGLGEKAVKNIIDYRIENGSFTKLSDLTKVKLIGAGTLTKITPFIEL
ncbi:MAG: Eco47II family restriction endonuclease [Colwellia sp.]|nr:Eco47II family restriction endonuclease [Colwellia sp.]